MMNRRKQPSAAAPAYNLKLPAAESAAQKPVILDRSVNPQTVQQLVVSIDDVPVDSPFMSVHGPQFLAPSNVSAESGDTAKTQRKLFRVDSCNIYVLVNPTVTENIGDVGKRDQTPLLPDNEMGKVRFEDLQIGEALGSGSQGTVRAVTYNGKKYALKRISISQALDKTQAVVERQARKNAIVRELQMLAQTSHRHENLVALYNGYFRTESVEENALHILMECMGISVEALFLAASRIPPSHLRTIAQSTLVASKPSEKISGGQGLYYTLDDETLKVRLTPLPEAVVSMIAHDALRGLDHMHRELRFVHTDIKPANLMFDKDMKVVKVADFGCSQQLPAELGSTVSGNTNVTLGTKLYMSPERAAAALGDGGCTQFNEATDIWSLGISLLELVAGVHPCHHFRENYWNFAELLHINKLLPPEQCSSLFWDFISQMLRRDYEKRPSAAALIEHNFIKKYSTIPRSKLQTFILSVQRESAQYEGKRLAKQIEQHLSIAAQRRDPDHVKRNERTWKGFSKPITGIVPVAEDTSVFPPLAAQ